jgi:hypothetical protein
MNIKQHRAERAARRRTTGGPGLNILLVIIVPLGMAIIAVAALSGAHVTIRGGLLAFDLVSAIRGAFASRKRQA